MRTIGHEVQWHGGHVLPHCSFLTSWHGLTVPMCRLELTVDAHNVRMVTFSTDADDASAGMTLTLARLQLALAQALNRPAPAPVLHGMSRISSKR